MHRRRQAPPNATILGTAIAIAPASVGCAVGLLLARRMKGATRQGVASLLFTIGALATVPLVVDYLQKTMNRPTSRRGADRALEAIRGAGMDADVEVIGGEEFFIDNLAER